MRFVFLLTISVILSIENSFKNKNIPPVEFAISFNNLSLVFKSYSSVCKALSTNIDALSSKLDTIALKVYFLYLEYRLQTNHQ